MKVLITGGSGNVGRAVTERLVGMGWDVRVIGIEPEANLPGADYVQCDILDYAALRESVRGHDGIIHLAAIPNPMVVPSPQLFQINVSGTYNLFEAAEEEGIKRIVQASSINAFGCFWGNVDITPQYFPIDEAHPTFTTDPYSFSKSVVEEIGDYYWRRAGISSVALRFPGVWTAERRSDLESTARRADNRQVVEAFAALPTKERREKLADVHTKVAQYRQQRMLEYPAAANGFQPTEDFADPLWSIYLFDRLNFWTFVDDRDSAQALEKGVTADFTGSHALFINAAENYLGYDSTQLVDLFFAHSEAHTPRWKRALQGSESLVDISKARALIGYEPLYGA